MYVKSVLLMTKGEGVGKNLEKMMTSFMNVPQYNIHIINNGGTTASWIYSIKTVFRFQLSGCSYFPIFLRRFDLPSFRPVNHPAAVVWY